jgi:hypothetical protein
LNGHFDTENPPWAKILGMADSVSAIAISEPQRLRHDLKLLSKVPWLLDELTTLSIVQGPHGKGAVLGQKFLQSHISLGQ